MVELTASGVESQLTSEVLAYLEVKGGQRPGLELLDDLIAAYTRRVPWESASRIVKKARVHEESDPVNGRVYARWPVEFWRDAMEQGTGGTCFESNYAFLALLKRLGYSGYLTVNNMEPTLGCHAAIVLTIDDRPWLVDAGLPVYAALPLDPASPTQRESPFHHYVARPSGPSVYRIERSDHPQPYCFTLIDKAVRETDYRRVLSNDYGPEGLFLDRVIITKVIEEHICRFNGEEHPYKLERFRRDQAESRALGSDLANEIGRFFSLDKLLIEQALRATAAIP